MSILISNIKDYEPCDIVYVDNIELLNKIPNSILKLDRVLEHLPDYNNKLLVGELGSVYKYKNVITDLFTISPPNNNLSFVISFLILLSTLLHIIRHYKYTKAWENNQKTDKNYQLLTMTFLSVSIITFIQINKQFNSIAIKPRLLLILINYFCVMKKS